MSSRALPDSCLSLSVIRRGTTRARPGLTVLLLTLWLLPLLHAAPVHAQAESSGALSQVDLLPLWGVTFAFPAEWVDGDSFPSQSGAHLYSGVSQEFQQVWDTLQPDGFNVLRVLIDTSDPTAAATRLANLCLWAEANGVFLLPVLATGPDRGAIPESFPGNAATVPAGVLALLTGGSGESAAAYTRILAYQVGERMNHPGWHGGAAGASALLRLTQAAAAVRRAEQERLASLGLAATPLVAGVSFDYEIVRAGGGVGCPLTDETFGRAYTSLQQFLSELAAAPEIDAVNVEWFAGSLSAGQVDNFSGLLGRLASDLPGKQLSFSTGFSTAFAGAEEQRQFFALTFANLADHRAGEGDGSPFVGVFFHQAIEGLIPDPTPPSSDLPTAVAQWNWCNRAGELAQVWRGELSSPDLSWWEVTAMNHMGLLAMATDETGAVVVASQTGQEAFGIIGESLGGATAQEGAPASPGSAGEVVREFGDVLKETAKIGMASLLGQVFDQLASKISFGGGGGGHHEHGTAAYGGEVPAAESTGEPTPAEGEASQEGSGSTTPAPANIAPGELHVMAPAIIATAVAVCRPKVAGIRFAGGAANPPVGHSAVTASLSNPCSSSISGLTASLQVDGDTVQSRGTGTLLPRQTRSVVFPDVKLAGGKVVIGVLLQSGSGKASTTIASLTTKVVPGTTGAPSKAVTTTRMILPGTTAIAAATSGVRGMAPVTGKGGATGTSDASPAAVPTPRPMTIVPPAVVRQAAPAPTPRPTRATAPAPVLTAPRTVSRTTATTKVPPTPTRTTTTVKMIPQAVARPTAGAPTRPDLAIASSDVRIDTPSQPKLPLRVQINVRNLGDARASGARVLCVLRADGKEAARKQLTANVSAGGRATVSWTTPMPAAKKLALEVSVSVTGEKVTGNNRAVVDIAIPTVKAPTKR